MKSTELRIGNLLLMYDTIITVAEINDVMIRHYERYPYYATIDHEGLKPIPLTEEWLLKFGFVKVGDNDSYFDAGSFVKGEVCIDSTMELAWYSDTPLEFVNQLQNLYFALTGEELEIK